MGGNALKNITETRRYSSDEYFAVVPEVTNIVRKVVGPAARIAVIPAYRSKPDFGDMDVLVEMIDGGPKDFRGRLLEAFKAPDMYANGSVYSIPLRDLQVDLILSSPEKFDFSHNYFSWNDTGNLVGRTAHKQGLIFGHDGLRFPVRDGDYQFRELVVTRDFGKALVFLGYDAKRFQKGFDGLQDIFEYVASSKFFNRDIFLLENRNAISRIRDSKRKTYMEFLKWCEVRTDLPSFDYPKDKSVWITHICDQFPGFKIELDKAVADLAVQRTVKAKFNGAYVKDLTGLDGQALGQLMQGFRNSFPDPASMQTFILGSTEQALRDRVLVTQSGFGMVGSEHSVHEPIEAVEGKSRSQSRRP